MGILCSRLIMLKMNHYQSYKPLSKVLGDVQATRRDYRCMPDDEKPHSHSVRLLAKNKLRRAVVEHIRNNRCPRSNHSNHTAKKLIASCLNKQSFTCMICLELLLDPALLSCGHSFCRPCIENLNHASNQNRCSLCRADDQLPFYEPDRTTDIMIKSIRHKIITAPEQKEYKRRQRRLRKQLAKRGAECTIHVHDQIKVRVKDSWLKAIVISIVETKENTYYEVQTNTEEIFMVNCRSKNILAKEQDLTKSREMALFLENTQSTSRPQPFREISNTYDIEDLLQVNTCPSNPWGFHLQSHSSLFFDLQLHSLDGFTSEVI